ncbi:putative peroxiredoxin [Acidithrix ferrooxidans]|uniref:Glutathione-dependent peroxiredoxin n=2 Tax=Acidimicrobiaceae TaxID=84994 RepID=A0A0D8HLX4_9ACTN|nr:MULTISPECIES: peroxiredoxin [Acidithrix]KJF18767.1 putative peroxiredoxin [Acidithrix ferrooxidans]
MASLNTERALVEVDQNSIVEFYMAIAVGDKIPDLNVAVTIGDKTESASSADLLGSGKVVLFAVPGAFTPTCSDYHLPGFVIRAEDIKAKNVGKIACISVNDSFVMGAWGKSQNVGDEVIMIADGNGDFTKAVGLELDGRGFGMGIRSQRYAMIIEDGIVTSLEVEPGGGLDVSSAEAILAKL